MNPEAVTTTIVGASMVQKITGLTPGTTYQYDWAAATGATGGTITTYANGATTPSNSAVGPAVMEVWGSA
jgi:hypothetical protein